MHDRNGPALLELVTGASLTPYDRWDSVEYKGTQVDAYVKGGKLEGGVSLSLEFSIDFDLEIVRLRPASDTIGAAVSTTGKRSDTCTCTAAVISG